MITPLTSDGQLDRKGLDRLIESQVSARVDALFILGSTGEGPQLSDAVYDEVARQSVELNDRRLPLLAGASDNSVSRCLERLERLALFGMDYGVVTLPFYGWPPNEARSAQFFEEIAARSPLPIVVYNLPKAVGWRMPPQLLEILCSIPNLVAIKDTHADFGQMVAIASSPKRAHISYLPGNSFLAARLLPHGADGVVTSAANIFPKPFVDLMRCFGTGRSDLAAQIDAELISVMSPLISYLPTGAASIKGLLESRGVCQRFTARTWPQASDADIAAMQLSLGAMEEAVETFSSKLADYLEDLDAAKPV